MSVFHSQSRLISHEPRLVVERISLTPGTRRIDSSSGRVTERIISSPGRSPLSAITVMRGNVTSGRSPAGRPRPAASPSTISTANVNAIARRWTWISRNSAIIERS